MITIEHLEVLFDAERQRDELVFAQLFARYIARHDEQRSRATEAEAQARRERASSARRADW
jgi:hypothetical protein